MNDHAIARVDLSNSRKSSEHPNTFNPPLSAPASQQIQSNHNIAPAIDVAEIDIVEDSQENPIRVTKTSIIRAIFQKCRDLCAAAFVGIFVLIEWAANGIRDNFYHLTVSEKTHQSVVEKLHHKIPQRLMSFTNTQFTDSWGELAQEFALVLGSNPTESLAQAYAKGEKSGLRALNREMKRVLSNRKAQWSKEQIAQATQSVHRSLRKALAESRPNPNQPRALIG